MLGPIFGGDSLIVTSDCVVFVISWNCDIVAVDGVLIILQD